MNEIPAGIDYKIEEVYDIVKEMNSRTDEIMKIWEVEKERGGDRLDRIMEDYIRMLEHMMGYYIDIAKEAIQRMKE